MTIIGKGIEPGHILFEDDDKYIINQARVNGIVSPILKNK